MVVLAERKSVRALNVAQKDRMIIAGFATITKPLHRLTMKNQLFKWADDCEKAFSTLIDKLCRSPPLTKSDFIK